MSQDIFKKIGEGINESSKCLTGLLEEESEQMKVPLSQYEKLDKTLVISPLDNEKDRVWAFFTSSVSLEIADYIIYSLQGDDIFCFVLDLKKSKTNDNKSKGRKQIVSTIPLAKMLYEKTTGVNPEELKCVGIRVFGPPRGKKVPNKLEPSKDDDGKLVIVNYNQNKSGAKLTSLTHLVKEIKKEGFFN
ncbi:hypothetical protein [Sediminitomix flava]|uniref:Uncharacterized protein n=1 Tax=Sediminitomix flava TaxID=379075 RepID=A0A315ZBZ7_SEDFL|nr:hypothetical protein [Sediminitomix flava]PWJ42244.1 hypothetical protein BC781_103496 [Sediminitomix flava]